MRARTWAIAAAYRDPADYGVPELPNWEVCRDGGAVAFVSGDDEPFIAAESPVTVRL